MLFHMFGKSKGNRKCSTQRDAEEEGRLTDAVARPACVVVECGKYESGVLVRLCFCRHGYQDDEKGDQGRPQCGVPHRRQDLAVAIEEKAEGIDDLVCTDHVFRCDNAGYVMKHKHVIYSFGSRTVRLKCPKIKGGVKW